MNHLQLLSLFLISAGFIVGLGSVTVIDWLGFMSRKSQYWTLATVRAHKVTKPLIWVGISLLTMGMCLGYYSLPTYISSLELGWIILLIANGSFLSFVVSPRLLKREAEGKAEQILPFKLQAQIAMSMIISVIGWWGLLIWLLLKI